MIDNTDLEDLINLIENTIQGFEEGFEVELTNYAAQIQDHMLGGDFKSRSGDLRRSMKVSIIDQYAIQVAMVYYGYFLAFGVDIRRETGARTFGVPEEVVGALNTAGRGRKITNNWKFGQASKSKRVFGIAARGTSNAIEGSNSQSFYPDDVLTKLEELILKYNEL